MAIIFESREGIARITINRPDVLNALDPATYTEITEAFQQIDHDPDILVGIVTGAGEKAFTAGRPAQPPRRPPTCTRSS